MVIMHGSSTPNTFEVVIPRNLNNVLGCGYSSITATAIPEMNIDIA